MKTCPVCGLDLDESYLFCPEDGSALHIAQPALAETAIEQEKRNKNTDGVVLYCPACAAEYPLTFSACPVHQVPLTKHKIPAFVAPKRKLEPNIVVPVALPLAVENDIAEKKEPQKDLVTSATNEANPSFSITDESAQTSESRSHGRFRFRSKSKEPTYTLMGLSETARHEEPVASPISESSSDSSLDRELMPQVESSRSQSSFRNAAYIIVVCLILFGLLGAISLYRSLSRRPDSSSSKKADKSIAAAQQPVAVYTPQAALDYKEPTPEPESQEIKSEQEIESAAQEVKPDRETARSGASDVSVAQPKRSDDTERKPPLVRQEPAPASTSIPVSKPAPASELVLPRGTFGRVDARLLNVKSRKTQNGIRYDLTFNMQDQGGQTTQWERLSISTRSASGISKSQVMPFYHRLGAAGTLTFTVSVEMQGRSQPDWQGRIICTSIGTDQSGKSSRASFGANVSAF